jgi:addiction module RelE/StbE family toxin
MIVTLTPQFSRRFRKLNPQLQKEASEKIRRFANDLDDPTLHNHSLKGKLQGVFSFHVNYKIRILYQPLSKDEVALLTIGDHDVYN